MQMNNDCGCNNSQLGFLDTLSKIVDIGGQATDAFSNVLDPITGASMPNSAAGPITVSPAIQTQVSPQISPVFQQQFQPSNSAATAGTTQSLNTPMSARSGSPVPGAENGNFDFPSAGSPSIPFEFGNGYGNTPANLSPIYGPANSPANSFESALSKYWPFLLGGVALIAAAAIISRNRSKAN